MLEIKTRKESKLFTTYTFINLCIFVGIEPRNDKIIPKIEDPNHNHHPVHTIHPPMINIIRQPIRNLSDKIHHCSAQVIGQSNGHSNLGTRQTLEARWEFLIIQSHLPRQMKGLPSSHHGHLRSQPRYRHETTRC